MEEQDFINDLRAGKQFAYGKLLDLFQQKVFATCISFVPNKEDAEDIAQDVFVEVFNSINKFKGNSKLSTWIYRITTNKCLEFIRKKNTKKRFAFLQSIMGNEIPMDKTKYFTEMNHPGVLLENKQKSETLFKAINQLPRCPACGFYA
ncbi:RNA polymerase [Algibacter lectus]|uniref:RNA polymerase sigma factor n=1 Tax=Algibacter lectus TaxID=221126 RepID=A0A090X4R9_9FLAO|nr:sigma-70 family RNA polymerase sigma factor [Algibacter lectus]GAL78262.1 RNA polymerase [Algibacter lectus]